VVGEQLLEVGAGVKPALKPAAGRRAVDQDRLGIRRIEQERTKSLSLCRWLTFQLWI